MPLADILAPLIAKKANQIATDLGQPPPAALGAGYLQPQARGQSGTFGVMPSMGANPGQVSVTMGGAAAEHAKLDAAYAKRLAEAKKKEKVPAPGDKGYEPRASSDRFNAYVAGGQKMKGKTGKQGMAEMFKAQHGEIMPMPNANAPGGEPVAMDELGRPIYQSAAPAPSNIIPAPAAGQPAAFDEAGRPVDARGRRMGGYLDQEAMNPGMRYLDLRPGDLNLDRPKDEILKSPFMRQQLDQMYGKHLHARDEGKDAAGAPTDKFPTGYLEGLKHSDGTPYTSKERANVKEGVQLLRDIQKLEEKGTPI